MYLRPTRKPQLVPAMPAAPTSANHADLPRVAPPHPPGQTVFRMGTALFDQAIPVGFSTSYADVHMAVLGESGSGKSKFLELYNRYLLYSGEGGMIVDPDNDLADAILGFIAYRYKIGDEAIARR